MTEEERALLNAEAVHDDQDRMFCGTELEFLTPAARRYVERMVARYTEIKAAPTEISLAYAFLLTHKLPEMRRVSRDFDKFEASLDKWIESLPDPVPEGELLRLEQIVGRDMKLIEAASVDVVPKPGHGEEAAGDAPPNS